MDHDQCSPLILPDSRIKGSRQAVRGSIDGGETMNWTPVFCANCGTPYGYVPEQTVDFACWLCNPCADKWGDQYGLALMPEEAFWLKAHQEMKEKFGRILTAEELQKVTETSTPLTTLLREGA